MSAGDRLRAKAHEYELKSSHEAELDEARQADGEFPGLMPTVWATVAVALREVADVLDADREAA